jgi:hypothetical protein
MKEMDKQSNGSVAGSESSPAELTFFEQVTDIQVALAKEAGLTVDPVLAQESRDVPEWCAGIVERLRKTILNPILKLRPNGVVNWRNYGKMIGIFERYKTFITDDVERMFKEEGFDKITEQQWEKLVPLLGLEKLREQLAVFLGRPLPDEEPLENAVDELLERQFKHLDNLKAEALRHVAQQDAKTTSLFFKGMAEGYNCFLGVDGRFVSDRGRTWLYMEFLAHRMEIEKYRRTNPGKSRSDLQNWLCHDAKIPIPKDTHWFDHFCDEICLGMKGVGRKRNSDVL